MWSLINKKDNKINNPGNHRNSKTVNNLMVLHIILSENACVILVSSKRFEFIST